MIPMTYFNFELPASFQGKWKFRMEMVFKEMLKNEKECIEFNLDIMEA